MSEFAEEDRKRLDWFDRQIANERHQLDRGRGSQESLNFLIRHRDALLERLTSLTTPAAQTGPDQ